MRFLPGSCSSASWVKVYNYEDDAAPLLPAGTIVHIIGWYDNSAKNPRNSGAEKLERLRQPLDSRT